MVRKKLVVDHRYIKLTCSNDDASRKHPRNISVWKVIFDEKLMKLISRFDKSLLLSECNIVVMRNVLSAFHDFFVTQMADQLQTSTGLSVYNVMYV